MGMVVRTNTMATNAYRQLGMNNSAVAKSLEKLSSGFRINRAGDDAAGLAISEKMKAQIKGLETASANAQDGISLIQTAEGNLNEVHDMLNRMVELATKSANGTYTSQERKALQDEVDSLLDEIDRISKSANFNGTKLLNGTMGMNAAAFTIGNSTDAVKAQTKVGDAIGTGAVAATHFNTGTTQVEQKPSFTIDLGDLEFTQAADGANKGTVEWAPGGITIGSQALTFVADAATATNTAYTTALEGTQAADKDTDAKLTGAEIVTKLTAAVKHAVIDDEVFSVTGTGTKLTLTWVGKADSANKLDTSAKVNDDTLTTWNNLKKGNVTIADATAKTGGSAGAISSKGRDNCHLTAIVDAKKETSVVRAGGTLKLTADMLQVGAKIKIGETEFTFVDKKETGTGAASGNEIALKDIGTTDAEKLEAVTRQLSKKTTTVKDADGTAHNFVIGRGNATDTIEIEEVVITGANPAYGKFTEAQMKNAFSYTTAPANAQTELTLTNASLVDGDAITIGGTTYKFTEDGADGTVKIGADDTETLNNLKAKLTAYDTVVDGSKITIKAKTATEAAPVISGGGLTLQIGDTAETFNKMNVAVADMSAKGLGLDKLKTSGIMTESSASKAIDKIKTAINTVSSTRAGMGALQNRLEHTINNLDVAAENLSAANSRIRDTDMAKEMMNYTKMNVLVQSAQAMLAQANQQPQSVLQLLQ